MVAFVLALALIVSAFFVLLTRKNSGKMYVSDRDCRGAGGLVHDTRKRSVAGGERVMRKIMLLVLMLTLTLALAVPAFAQDYDYSYVCDDMRNSFFVDGGINLTAADLLSCGMSPEAIGAQPSINGPYGVGTQNECSYLPLGSPEAKSCYEWLTWSMGY